MRVSALTFPYRRANLVGVALIAGRTNARCPMRAHFADGVDAAMIVVHAGILALLLNAGQRVGAVGIDGAFRLAFHIGIALEAEWAAALTGAAGRAGNGVPPTWVWLAGVDNVWLDGRG